MLYPCSPTCPHRAQAITVINLKGGVGKTHTCWLLAGVCEERGKRVLVIDTDTQGNITKSLLTSGGSPLPGVEALFDPRTDTDPLSLIRRTRFAHIDLLPSSPVLATYDLSDQRLWEKSDLHLSLAEGLRGILASYDYLVFDCPPRLSLVSLAALCASDEVIIPLEAADWGAQGIVQVTAAANAARETHNPSLHLLGYLVSRYKPRRSYQRSYLAKLREHFGPLAFDTVIPDLAGYEKSVTHSVPITLHAPASREASVARSLFDEVERRIGKARGRGPEQSRRDVRSRAHAAAV
jgi:chromosome partitioning protein